MDNVKYWLWLSILPGIGSRRFNQLVSHFGSPEAVWNAELGQLKKISGISEKIIAVLLDPKYKDNMEPYMHKIEKSGIKVFRSVDEDYPSNLKSIPDFPPVLYVRGSIEEQDQKAIAIVGSRTATQYGMNMAEELAYGLAMRGVTVVSGMARGIDTYAHRGALQAGGRTVAVLGCGVDISYPPENKNLIDKVVKSGAVISEFAAGMKPLPANFPARNRIISGLSMGVVVVEAAEKSGALITVDFALEQGRDVFAVPGNASSMVSEGTNRLIKDGAKLITCVDDILEEFGTIKENGIRKERPKVKEYAGLDDDERRLVENLDDDPTHIENLLKKTGYNIQKVNTILTMLEMKGVLKQLPGKFFIRA